MSQATRVDISSIIAPFAERLQTKAVVLESDLLPRGAQALSPWLPQGTWAMIWDENTWRVAGQALAQSLQAANIPLLHYKLEPAQGEDVPVADDAKVAAFKAWLQEQRPAAVVAVGSGTINDIAKMATFQAGLPYAVLATAPSMNGYTSAIAALLSDGVKVTLPCHAPVACLADLEVVAQAPYRMIASGYGDLLSKPVSNADWRLGARLLGADYSPETIRLVEQGFAFLEGVAPRLAAREPEAIGRLMATLSVSGMAMAVAGSSSPASGGEHLISHYIDMTHFAYGDPHDFHGCQVGVGTITTAALYEKLTAMKADDIDVDAIVAAHTAPEAYEALTRQRFGALSEAVVPHMRQIYPDAQALRQRLTLLKENWEDILADVNTTLRPAARIQQDLLDARCPVTFAEIGVTPERARASVLYSKDIRARYTILHLAAELGKLEAWTSEVLASFHGVR